MLSVEEQAAFAAFKTQHPKQPDILLLRCLIARKFELDRAEVLLTAYETELSAQTGNPSRLRARDVLAQLKTGEISVPGGCDAYGSKLIVYSAAKHVKQLFSHEDTIRTVLYAAECAQQTIAEQKAGITVICDMTNVSWGSLDRTLIRTLVKTLQDRYPARLGSLLVVMPSWVLSSLVAMGRPFMKRKLVSKLSLVKTYSGLHSFVDPSQLPRKFHGTMDYDHAAWVANRLEVEGESDIIPEVSAREELEEKRAARLKARAASTSVPATAATNTAKVTSAPAPTSEEASDTPTSPPTDDGPQETPNGTGEAPTASPATAAAAVEPEPEAAVVPPAASAPDEGAVAAEDVEIEES